MRTVQSVAFIRGAETIKKWWSFAEFQGKINKRPHYLCALSRQSQRSPSLHSTSIHSLPCNQWPVSPFSVWGDAWIMSVWINSFLYISVVLSQRTEPILTRCTDEGEAEASHFVMAVKLLVKFSIMCQNQWRLKVIKMLSHDTIIPLAVFPLIQYFLLSSDGYTSMHMPVFSLLKSRLFFIHRHRSILFSEIVHANDS